MIEGERSGRERERERERDGRERERERDPVDTRRLDSEGNGVCSFSFTAKQRCLLYDAVFHPDTLVRARQVSELLLYVCRQASSIRPCCVFSLPNVNLALFLFLFQNDIVFQKFQRFDPDCPCHRQEEKT